MERIKKWETLEETDISLSKWFPLFKQKVKLPNGKIIDDFYVSKLGDCGMVVAVTKDKEIVFVRQYKQGVKEITVELPAGRLNKDENPEECARRELLEETGYVAERLIPLGYVWPTPTKDPTRINGFIAESIKIKNNNHFDETENIEIIKIPVTDVKDWIDQGKIKGSDTIAILILAKKYIPELL